MALRDADDGGVYVLDEVAQSYKAIVQSLISSGFARTRGFDNSIQLTGQECARSFHQTEPNQPVGDSEQYLRYKELNAKVQRRPVHPRVGGCLRWANL